VSETKWPEAMIVIVAVLVVGSYFILDMLFRHGVL